MTVSEVQNVIWADLLVLRRHNCSLFSLVRPKGCELSRKLQTAMAIKPGDAMLLVRRCYDDYLFKLLLASAGEQEGSPS